MKTLLVLLVLSNPALAAEPELCRPYATKVAEQVIRFSWDRAYTTCLNSDEVPDAPATDVDAARLVVPGEVVLPPGEAPALGPSGAEAGSDEWKDWCRKNYRTFRSSDGTVVRHRNRKRVQCPG